MKLVIYQTSDIHGYVYPTNYVQKMPLGLLTIASYIKEDEQHYDASLKIDCGDLIQGSPMTHYLHKREGRENVITKGMQAFGYDVYVLGNHEFNYGLHYLKTAYEPLKEKLLNANIIGLPLYSKPYQIFTYGKFKIACIGLTTSFIPNWEQQQNIENVTFLDPVESYRKYEQEMISQADMIVVCYHGGFEKSVDETMLPTEKLTKENQASELLETFDSIAIILSGHQHRSIMTQVNGVICSQTLNNGQEFSKIVIDTETKQIDYALIQTAYIKQTIAPAYEAIFHETQTKLEEYLEQKVGHFQQDLIIQNIFQARLHGHPLLNFLHQVQLDKAHADISVTSLFDAAIGFRKEVSIRDVLINYPYPNTLRVLKMSGHKIKEAIEKSATYFVLQDNEVVINESFLKPKIQNYNYDTYGGLIYEIDLTKPFNKRVTHMIRHGKEMDLDATYTIVLNNYRATNTSIYPCYEGAQVVQEINIDMSEIIIDYLQAHSSIDVPTTSNYTYTYK